MPNKLKNLELVLQDSNIGHIPEILPFLVQGIKQLPSNLKDLKLDLAYTDLAENADNFKNLNKVVKYLPVVNLKNLQLNLYSNNLGENTEDMKYFAKGI